MLHSLPVSCVAIAVAVAVSIRIGIEKEILKDTIASFRESIDLIVVAVGLAGSLGAVRYGLSIQAAVVLKEE